MLDHFTVTVTDLAAAAAFYDAALAAVGWVRLAELVDEEEDAASPEAIGWGAPGGEPALWAVLGAAPTSGLHVCLQADSHAEVETFFAAATDSGGTAHSAPRRWAIYRPGKFNAIVRDPGGNLIEVVAPA